MTHEDNFDQFLSERTEEELALIDKYQELRELYIEESGINNTEDGS